MKQDWTLARLVYDHCHENPQYAKWGLHATEAFFYHHLPRQFSTAEAINLGRALGCSDRTTMTYLAHYCLLNLLLHPARGQYEKTKD